jgi:dipeptidase E
MRILLSSSGPTEKVIEKIESELKMNFSKLKLGVVISGLIGELNNKWSENEEVIAIQKLNPNITFIKLEDYKVIDFDKLTNDIDVIWVFGGLTSYLVNCIYQSNFDLVIEKLIEKGNLYVGVSAGSMIMSKTLETPVWYIGEEDKLAQGMTGLNYVNFEIYPHYQDKYYNEINSLWKNGDLYLLKDGEYIYINNENISFSSTKRLISK